MPLYPLKLKPVCKDYLWGGQKLVTSYGKGTRDEAVDKVAESWELSCHKDGLSTIVNGKHRGETLLTYIQEHPESVGEKGMVYDTFPLLIKFIDAKDNLSVQVHPDDAFALAHEGERGKNELWYILEAEEGASVFYGFSKDVSKDDIREHIAGGRLLDIVREIPVHAGDVLYIETGTLHAIGKGVLLVEIQQSSNATYRVYDYGRVDSDGKPRELHIEKALSVLKKECRPLRLHSLCHLPMADMDVELLATNDYFTVYHGRLKESLTLEASQETFHAMTLLKGEVVLTYLHGEDITLTPGDTLFIPAGLRRYTLMGEGDFLLTTL